jgi:uncharacterized iron-regulated protein
VILLLSLLFLQVSLSEEITIISAAGDTLFFNELADALMDYDVIFTGEEHDAKAAHDAELAILSSLARRDSNLVLALEMFERDVQDVLDSYLVGDTPEDSFLARSRPWPNYQTDYRPLVEFAKANKIAVVAANVPRRAAAAVARAGEVSYEVMGVDSVFMPDTFHLDSEEYYERFAATMQGMPASGPMGSLNVDALYKAQVLKDAVMAASLRPYLDRRILFFCGRFHSDHHLGIPYQLQKNHPDLKIAVVALASASERLSAEDRSGIADFLWVYTPHDVTE